MNDKPNLAEVLKSELEFLNRGGYRKSSWRPQFIFEDSPTCLNYHSQNQKPCSECVLMQVVPPEKREEKIPCRFIPLNERGDTIDSLYRSGTQEELESALRNWLTQEIEKLEKEHAGSVGVIREGKMKTDTELQHAVMEELAWEPSVDAAEIGVSAESGIVTLSGIVKSLPQKWAAEKAAQRVSGVQAVTDEMVVKLPGDAEITDTEIARAAVNALDWNASLPRGRVTLIVSHGWITLEGTLQFHYERVAAEYAVRGITGVKGVTNLISVKPPHTSPSDIKHRIERALERAADLDAQAISVETRDGKVILRGAVDSWKEREQAEWAAWAAPGVSQVENQIMVASGEETVASL